MLCFEAGQSVAPHTHPKSDEFFFVVEGKGRLTTEVNEQDAEGVSSELLLGLRID